MADNTMTLALDGNVPFKEFAIAIEHFYKLVDALAIQFQAKESVEWFVDDLVKSSAIATIRGESQTPRKIEQVIEGYAIVARALEANEPVPYSPRVRRHANAIREIVNGQVTAVRFETAESDIVVSDSPRPQLLPPALGAVEGRIQTLTNRVSLRFTLFDSFHDRAVSCYLDEGQETIIREAWGRRAIVEGLVAREPDRNRPVTIRGVSSIEILSDDVPHYHDARGIIAVHSDAPSSEDIIRRLRDA